MILDMLLERFKKQLDEVHCMTGTRLDITIDVPTGWFEELWADVCDRMTVFDARPQRPPARFQIHDRIWVREAQKSLLTKRT